MSVLFLNSFSIRFNARPQSAIEKKNDEIDSRFFSQHTDQMDSSESLLFSDCLQFCIITHTRNYCIKKMGCKAFFYSCKYSHQDEFLVCLFFYFSSISMRLLLCVCVCVCVGVSILT